MSKWGTYIGDCEWGIHHEEDMKYWTTLEGERIAIVDLGDDHLNNIINMLARNGKKGPPGLYTEQLERFLKRLLKDRPDEMALWLLSNNPKMRDFAKSCGAENETTS